MLRPMSKAKLFDDVHKGEQLKKQTKIHFVRSVNSTHTVCGKNLSEDKHKYTYFRNCVTCMVCRSKIVFNG